MELNTIIQGDVREVLKTLPDKSINCCVTSPPYWGLRDYGVEGQLGLEKTPEAYVERMVEVFREVRRVLRDDGTLWLNLGDSYASNTKSAGRNDTAKMYGAESQHLSKHMKLKIEHGLKPKDLVGIPWRVAFALQADGWWLRSDIIWAKPNPLPEGVKDRPTKAHEYIFLLSKSERYFYDAEAIKEMAVSGKDMGILRSVAHTDGKYVAWHAKSIKDRQDAGVDSKTAGTGFRNKRDVWTIPTQPFPGAHFAVFPEALVEPCILAGTSEKGCCPKCGAPWVRIVTREEPILAAWSAKGAGQYDDAIGGMRRTSLEAGSTLKHITPISTVGWQPTCSCGLDPVPCVTLDPFGGSGTVAKVSRDLGRESIYCDLNPDYVRMAMDRVGSSLFSNIEYRKIGTTVPGER